MDNDIKIICDKIFDNYLFKMKNFAIFVNKDELLNTVLSKKDKYNSSICSFKNYFSVLTKQEMTNIYNREKKRIETEKKRIEKEQNRNHKIDKLIQWQYQK